jgi:plastocyanin
VGIADCGMPKCGSLAGLAGRIATLALPALLAVAVPVRAQGTVRGRVSITERPEAQRNDVGNAVVYLEATSAGGARSATPAYGTMEMREREFLPHVRIVGVGGAVAFPNEDPFRHNVFSNTALLRFDLGLYRQGASKDATFRRAGVYPIYCNIHARMVGFVLAVSTPYYVQPTVDGEFWIPDIPRGTYLLHVWHERATEVTRALVVPPGGVEGVRIVLDASEYTPAPHLNKFGLPYTARRRDRY